MVWDLPWMEHLPELACPWKEENKHLPPPNSRGGREHWLRPKDNRAWPESEDNLSGTTKGVECDTGGGSRGRCSGMCDLLRPRNGLALALCICFALRSSKVLSCPCERSHLLVLLHSPSWSLHHGECSWGRSEPCRISPFLDLSRSLS